MGQIRGGARLAALGCALLLVGPLAAPAAAAGPGAAEPGAAGGYRFAADARPVAGTASSADAPTIEAGGVYTDEIAPGETRHYALSLDHAASAYVTTVAVPGPGAPLGSSDTLEVELLTTDNESCSTGRRSFSSAGTARPVAAWAGRTVAQGAPCQRAGVYFYSVTRGIGGDPEDWPVELRFTQEPPLAGIPESAPELTAWETEPPAPPGGAATRVAGGTGFNDAQPIGEGVWRDDLAAGDTLVYRVPVDWGQQLAVDVELANATDLDPAVGSRADVLVELYNPAGAWVDADGAARYGGEQLSVPLLTPGVHYGNRFLEEYDALRLAGWHYLVVTLAPEAAELTRRPVGLTLRLALLGERAAGPAYATDLVEAGFGVTDEMVAQADGGLTDAELAAERATDRKRQRGYLAIGAGAVLSAGIGLWHLVARRRAVAAAGPVPGSP
ncbi:hypothetical protein RM844_12560 [Streptomyces sp. DSM 44915]|uniref:Uncharacterized protein n=1 Tax=Streptomyces chisholmiae TaxID=3075540 RepID=A0ABU2JQ46_9ACTN|nr:hypothetical protein [Streptomyces sp. DSM 44915]MDT0267122.1 hypothetical protein [Streptomyces sp. DSM 44915]